MKLCKNILSVTVIFLSFICLLLIQRKVLLRVLADDSNTQVTVANSGPSFKGGTNVYESPKSDSTTPTNEGTNVPIKATSIDPNDDNYFLIVCSTDSVTPEGGAGNAPSCGATQYCLSSSQTDEVEATCNASTTGLASESYVWYAFVCDDVVGSMCSTSSQGTLSDGSESPFKVNHAPSFTAVVDDGGSGPDSGANPDGSITFTATATDSDTDGSADQLKVVVCTGTTSGVVLGSPSTCTGGTLLCETALGTLNCNYDVSVGNVIPDGNYDYKAFVFDSHSFGSSPSSRSGQYTVNNVAPTVTAGTLNGSSNITLTEGTTTNVIITGTVVDTNSCTDVSGNVDAYFYRSGVGYAGCLAQDDDSCYFEVSCSTSDCSGTSDSTANYTCTAAVKYHADPTDDPVYTQYPAETWGSTIKANDGQVDDTDATTNVEMLTLNALRINDGVSTTINYGSMNPGENSDTTNQTTVINATGNVGLDTDLYGTDMTYSSYTITVENQKYSATTFDYDLAGNDLEYFASKEELELNVPKTYYDSGSTNVGQQTIYWGIAIPLVAGSGTYNGTNTIAAIVGEVANW